MIKGKLALVTGSTSGIGLGIAHALARQGADLVLNGFGEAAAIERLRGELAASYGVRVDYEGADLSQPAEIEAMFARIAARGVVLRLIALRLIAPLQTEVLERALAGVRQVLVVEQNHGGQLLRYLRSRADLPGRPSGLHRPGPLPLRPGELADAFVAWAAAHARTTEHTEETTA